MERREQRIQIFQETMDVCSADEDVRRAMMESIVGQRIIWEEAEEPGWVFRFDRPAAIVVSRKRSLEAARPYAQAGKKVCVLNFASSVSPGGGVVRGAQAQEESLCRISTLYPALSSESGQPFYARHWEMIHAGTMKRENRDDCIYTPGVVVVREDAAGEALLPKDAYYPVDVVTCAAPDLRVTDDDSMYAPTEAELFGLLIRRWRRILAVAAANQAQVLILGAFGCGVFANPPRLVAKAFAQALAGMEHCFETIEFAIYSAGDASPNYQAFAEILARSTAE